METKFKFVGTKAERVGASNVFVFTTVVETTGATYAEAHAKATAMMPAGERIFYGMPS